MVHINRHGLPSPKEVGGRLGKRPALHPEAEIRDCWFGPYTAVGARTRMMETRFGAYSYIVDDGDVTYSTIGKFCSIARAVRVNPGNHPSWRASQHHFIYRAEAYGLGQDEASFFDWRRDHDVVIGHDVWIGHGATVLAGVRIEAGSIVAAGAVVSKDVAPYTVVAGVPAKPIKRRFEPDIAERLMALAWWDWEHEQLKTALADFRSLSVEAFLERHGA
ncbi:MAG: chloramphenicol acetyltransferase [Geminicoccaceae bacterium]